MLIRAELQRQADLAGKTLTSSLLDGLLRVDNETIMSELEGVWSYDDKIRRILRGSDVGASGELLPACGQPPTFEPTSFTLGKLANVQTSSRKLVP